MVPSFRKPRTARSSSESSFSGSLRFELVDQEERALLGSYAIASAIGIAFLLLVRFGPHMPPATLEKIRIEVGDLGGVPIPQPSEILARHNLTGGQGRSANRSGAVTGSISNAFAGNSGAPIVGQTSNILGGITVTRPGSPDAESGGKTVLAYGEGGVGSLAPGRGGIAAGTGSGRDIGGVQGSGTVARSTRAVGAVPVVAVDPLPARGDAAGVGTFVRGHESQLRFCYEEHGLRANPALAGSVTVAVTVSADGAVSAAHVTKRSWSGAGAADSETCILRAIRGWRLPASPGGAGTYSFPFNFSR